MSFEEHFKHYTYLHNRYKAIDNKLLNYACAVYADAVTGRGNYCIVLNRDKFRIIAFKWLGVKFVLLKLS